MLQGFCERLTEGRASWAAAIHDGPDDRDNPHAHIIFRDRDWLAGKRVMLTTEQGSTQRFRDGWEDEVNRALEREGFEERIDKRSLKDQGIGREPQIHVGAASKYLHEKDHEFRSEEKQVTRIIDGVPVQVTVNYPVIDDGKTRWQENEDRKDRNAEQERAMAGVVAAERQLHDLYVKSTKSGTMPDDPSDPLSTLVAFHMRDLARTEEQRENYELWTWRPLQNNIGEPHSSERTAKRGPTDMIAGAGLSLIGKISKSLESIFDGPQRDPEDKEQNMAEKQVTPQQQRVEANLREQTQRTHEADIAKWRQKELEAYLDQRDKERHIDRGR
ncbi:MobA/MobL family protein [Bradyrhizobium sp. WSM2254]|uniref:MobA/MobL family protein n=1 Tax=Bradyrhizobium sp. WSM2254 TaxID=1188263 RepID=UPI000418DBB9|nr:MobA/MobL family protein [Bradyrhizobium sp. WSM2254]